jgi:cell division protease FtsH
MDRKTEFNIWFVIVAFLGVLVFQYAWHTARTVATIPYSEFQQLARDDKVAEVVVTENHIQGRLKEPLPDGQSQFITRKVEPDLTRELAAKGVTVMGATEETLFGQVLSWVLPALVFFGVWMLLMRRLGGSGLGGGFMQIGKSKARIYVETDTKVTFQGCSALAETE